MKRSIALFAFPLALLALASASPASAQQKKPNIVFIMGDDIGWMQLASYQQGLGLGGSCTTTPSRAARRGATPSSPG
jgi:hypothetical protein